MTIMPSCAEKTLALSPTFQPSRLLPSKRLTNPSSGAGVWAGIGPAASNGSRAATRRKAFLFVFEFMVCAHCPSAHRIVKPEQLFASAYYPSLLEKAKIVIESSSPDL